MTNIAAIGECMLELSHPSQGGQGVPERGGHLNFSYGGDTLNTCIYLTRLGVSCRYVTALGDDPYSDWLVSEWGAEGIDTSQVERVAGRCPGLYMIRTDAAGERQFTYWRGEAPVRELFADQAKCDRIFVGLENVQTIYLSGITLSLFDADGLERLFAALEKYRNGGGTIAFDSNYRPRGWKSADEASGWFTRLYGMTTIALPTLADEALLFGDAKPEDTADRLLGLGVAEVIVKDGPNGALVCQPDGRAWAPRVDAKEVVDTTAAGDSFNAGYLAARTKGVAPLEAAAAGCTLATEVIQHRGAILPVELMPNLLESHDDSM